MTWACERRQENMCALRTSGGWFNIKMASYQYRKSHCGEKTILRPSYLHNVGLSILVRWHLYIESGLWALCIGCVTACDWASKRGSAYTEWLYPVCRYLNPLRAKFFKKDQKHIFAFYVIPPHWHGTGCWNPSSYKTRTYLFYMVNIMGADVLATQGARAAATMILTILIRINSVPAH